jgi:superoxide oxidase
LGVDNSLTEGRRIPARPRAGRFDQASIALHWLTVLLVAGQLMTAWLIGRGAGDVALFLTLHRSMGTATFVTVVLRLVWRHRFASLPPFPPCMPRTQQWIASLSERGLYALLVLQPLTGLAMMLFRGRPFTVFFWQMPALLASNQPVSLVFRSLHKLGALALLTLIGLHTAAALLHGLILRDGVLQRMLPWTAR